MTSRANGPWLPYGTGAGAAVRLFCLPHAGSGASVYRAWGVAMPPAVAVCPVQLPGREQRFGDAPYLHFRPLVRDLAKYLIEVAEPPYAVFGHSVGAMVAFELVRELERQGGVPPVHLFVAGRHAPHLPSPEVDLRDAPVARLADAMRELGGTPEVVLNDPDLLATTIALLRADLSVNETYDYVAQPPLDVPVAAFAATADPRASCEAIADWERHTRRQFQLHVLPGGHFAILKHAAIVHSQIVAALAGSGLLADGARH